MSVIDMRSRKPVLLTEADLKRHDAEASIASILVQRPDRLGEALELVDLDLFECQTLRQVIETASALHRRDGSVSLAGLWLAIDGARIPIRSSAYGALWDLAAPSQSLRPFAEAVRRGVTHRRVRESLDALNIAVDEGSDIEAHVRALQEAGALRAGDELMPMLDVMRAEIDVIQREWDGDAGTRWSTGLGGLDVHLNGGLKGGQLVVIGGRPGSGKSSLALQMADAVASAGGRVHVYSGEMLRGEVARRLMSLWCDAPGAELQRPREMRQDTMDRIVDDVHSVSTYRMLLDDRPGKTWSEVAAGVMRSAFRLGGLDLVLVDYLQLLRVPERATEYTEYTAASKAAKALALELGCVVVLVCQLNRAQAQRAKKAPIITDLRATGQIEQDANVILFPYRPAMDEEDAPEELAQIDIAKHREGRTCVVPARWVGEFTRFETIGGRA